MQKRELTASVISDLKKELEASGYVGPVRKTTVGTTEFVYRAISVKELRGLIEDLQKDPDSTNADLANSIVQTAVAWPKLERDELEQYGFGVVSSLREKIELLSGVLVDAVAHFVADEELTNYVPWEDISELQLAQLRKKWAENPFVQLNKTWLLDFPFVYRNITGSEYAEIVKLENESDYVQLETVVKMAVVYPENIDWTTLPAHFPDVLRSKIYLLSGVSLMPSIEDDEEI